MHAPPSQMSTRTLIQFAIVTLIWGSTWLVIKTQLGPVPTSWSITYRFLSAAAAMLAFCLVTRTSFALGVKGHAFALVLAVLQFCLNFNFVYRAEGYITSGLVAVAFALLIVPNALLGWAVLGQRVNAMFALGSLIGIAGVALLFHHEFTVLGGNSVPLGIGLTLAGVLSASIANIMQATPTGRSLPPYSTLAMALLYGGLIDAAVAFVVSGPPVIDPTPSYVAGFLYLGVLGSAITFPLYFDMIRTIGPARAAYCGLLIPFVAMALSTLFEDYVWTPTAVAGGVLALFGLWIALRART